MTGYMIQRDSDLALFCGFNFLSAMRLQLKWAHLVKGEDAIQPVLYPSLEDARQAQHTGPMIGIPTALISVGVVG